MKTIEPREVHRCDSCNNDHVQRTCFGCGAEHCWECKEKLGLDYTRIYNGAPHLCYLCRRCDTNPPAHATDLRRAILEAGALEALQHTQELKLRADVQAAWKETRRLFAELTGETDGEVF